MLEFLSHPITIGILCAAAPVGPLVLWDRARRLRRYEDQFQSWFGAPLSSVLNAPTREEGVNRMREVLGSVSAAGPATD